MKKIMAFALCLTLLLSAFAGGAMAEEEPVVIENMGRTTTYEEAPETAVALSYSIAEIMVALGLEDKIVAIAPSMYILDQVSEEYRETVGSFPVLEGNYHHSAPHSSAQSVRPASEIFPIQSAVPARSGNHAHRKRRRLTNTQTASPSSERMSSLAAIRGIQSGCCPLLPQRQSACHRLSKANNRQTWVYYGPRYYP